MAWLRRCGHSGVPFDRNNAGVDSGSVDRRRLLVLGAGPAQLGLLAAARRLGLFVIAVDRDPSAPGFAALSIQRLASDDEANSEGDTDALSCDTPTHRCLTSSRPRILLLCRLGS